MSDEKTINDKLDLILSKLDGMSQKTDMEVAKEEFKKFMLKNFNISWINDDIEGDIYDSLFSFVESLFSST